MTTTTPATGDERWLAENWPFVRDHLPTPPARVLEIGCGPLGGFMPALHAAGYTAVGVDPHAPEAPGFHRERFEDHGADGPVDVITACTSLHHVDRLDTVVDRIHATLRPGGTLIVLEWAWERFDEPTARWCFAHLPSEPVEPGWLQRHHDRWQAAGTGWDTYLRGFATDEGLHTGDAITGFLTSLFATKQLTCTPYFSAGLDATSADEQTAIDAGTIQATGIRYVGRRAS
jgi:SAM-dependent methyltransferase